MNKTKPYNPKLIEPKWIEKWEKTNLYQAFDPPTGGLKKPKKYILIEFPYPSGERLHVGHGRSYTAIDAFSRKLRMQGFNVLYPIGWDAFGLPAENYAIKTGINPAITTRENIAHAKAQAKRWGLSFDWSREINTTDPNYYKWTQWIFLKMFEKGLAYQAKVPVNWCPECKTNLADEEVLSDGTHERCGQKTERRMQEQWLLKITAYADQLLDDLKTVNYLPKIAHQQINWIGRKEWIDLSYPVEGTNETIIVSTTRPDTNFGATFVVLAPEHPFVTKILEGKITVNTTTLKTIKEYVEIAKNKSELERITEIKKKTGVFTGLYAINQLNDYRMPIWIADFALMSVGTGAVVGVPGHDLRDFDFAKAFGLPVVRVVVGKDGDVSSITKREQVQEEEGTMINSDFLNGLDIQKATALIMDFIEKKGWGKRVIRYHLHDWVFSRQHYWGEPIPIIHCPKCGVVPVRQEDLPVKLPPLEKYQPTGTGESPLAQAKDWVNVKCPVCGGPARRETDTMPNWAGSNWYYLGYLVAKSLRNKREGIDIFTHNKDLIKYWMPVDLYNGGMEHTTLHLLYSRFVYKFLFDLGVVPGSEPYARRTSHGVVLGPDGAKMSKSRGNIVNPDDVINAYGADTFRLYEAFMGPFDQMIAWNEEGVEGCFRFLKRVWQLTLSKVRDFNTPSQLLSQLHQTVKKVSEDLDLLKFNTAIAAMMEFINLWAKQGNFLNKKDTEVFLQILAPFAPYLTEELWKSLGGKFSIHNSSWPKWNPRLIEEKVGIIVVEVNGKVRDKLSIKYQVASIKGEIEKIARQSEKVKKYLVGKKVKQVIFVPGKLINFVI